MDPKWIITARIPGTIGDEDADRAPAFLAWI